VIKRLAQFLPIFELILKGEAFQGDIFKIQICHQFRYHFNAGPGRRSGKNDQAHDPGDGGYLKREECFHRALSERVGRIEKRPVNLKTILLDKEKAGKFENLLAA
jgi:hypothetical protein